MQFMLLFSRQGKLRLQKWYSAQPDKAKKKITRDLVATILTRKPKMCSFLEWRELKIVYKRYATFILLVLTTCAKVFGSMIPALRIYILYLLLFYFHTVMLVSTFVVQLNNLTMNCSPWKSFIAMSSCWINTLEV